MRLEEACVRFGHPLRPRAVAQEPQLARYRWGNQQAGSGGVRPGVVYRPAGGPLPAMSALAGKYRSGCRRRT